MCIIIFVIYVAQSLYHIITYDKYWYTINSNYDNFQSMAKGQDIRIKEEQCDYEALS